MDKEPAISEVYEILIISYTENVIQNQIACFRTSSQIWPVLQRIRARRALQAHFQNFHGDIELETKHLRNEAKMALIEASSIVMTIPFSSLCIVCQN